MAWRRPAPREPTGGLGRAGESPSPLCSSANPRYSTFSIGVYAMPSDSATP